MIEALAILMLMVKRFEGCKLEAYQDIVGVWTIGWGETLNVVEGMVWSQGQADDVLRQRLGQFLLATLKRCPALHLASPEKLAACTSLAYNIGVGAFGASSVSRCTMRQEFEQGRKSFLLWNKAGGRVVRGLTIRRQAEATKYAERSY